MSYLTQWPGGTIPNLPPESSTEKRNRLEAAEVLAMLRKTTTALRTIGILNGELGLKARAAALALADESAALIARVEKQ